MDREAGGDTSAASCILSTDDTEVSVIAVAPEDGPEAVVIVLHPIRIPQIQGDPWILPRIPAVGDEEVRLSLPWVIFDWLGRWLAPW